MLAGELNFLDALLCTNCDDDGRRFYDVAAWSKKISLVFLLVVPQASYNVNKNYFSRCLEKLISSLELVSSRRITRASIEEAIHLCNETRLLLRRVYELLKQPQPAVMGSEVVRLCLAAKVMPKQEFNRELKIVLPYLENGGRRVKATGPRLLVSGDDLHDWRYLALIEDECGGVIAMDDLDTGSRYCWGDCVDSGDDLINCLADRYLSFPDLAGQGDWDRQIDRVVRWVREFNIQGVIELQHSGQYSRSMRSPYFRKRLADEGIKFMSVKTEYQLANVGQLRTRIGAFVEMLSS
jgi:benzoyl-CoA reductase/2-hydroxyglutaryl-CoA dehydratase subunit BcrC/BadD/HgdB